jgi:DnaJ-class molecular chaperone
MSNCLNCGQETNNPKFCSKSCAAVVNNHTHPKRGDGSITADTTCPRCHGKKQYTSKLCKECSQKIPPNRSIGDYHGSASYQANAQIRNLARTEYKRSGKPLRCTICGYDKIVHIWHIKAIKDFPSGTRVSIVNDSSNLVALCPNHHWELDHGLVSL